MIEILDSYKIGHLYIHTTHYTLHTHSTHTAHIIHITYIAYTIHTRVHTQFTSFLLSREFEIELV